MKEAWQYKSPFAYAVARRIELARWVFSNKVWHSSAKWTAKIRAFLLVLRGHETEICCLCGGRVGLVWWCRDNPLWTKLTGWEGGGVSCIGCFDRLALQAGILLVWSPTIHPHGSEVNTCTATS